MKNLIFFLTLVSINRAHAEISSANLVTQSVVGARACGPTALFYAFKLGNDEMRSSYKKLIGNSDEEKLTNLTEIFGKKPSLVGFHHLRLDENDGMAPRDLFETARDLFSLGNAQAEAAFSMQNLARHESESRPGIFTNRVYSILNNSLSKKVPLVAI